VNGNRWSAQIDVDTEVLSDALDGVIVEGLDYVVRDRKWLMALGIKNDTSVRGIFEGRLEQSGIGGMLESCITHILEAGNLSSRIRKALNGDLSEKNIQNVWHCMAECLRTDHMFNP
jgi:hypothetical protein